MARSGQFKKGGGRVGDSRGHKARGRKSSSRGLTIVEKVPAPVVKVVRVPTAMSGRRHSARGGGGGGGGAGSRRRNAHTLMLREHGAGEMIPGPFRLRSAAIAGLLGYADGGKGFTALKDVLDKLPSVGKVPKKALAGLLLNYFADRGDWLDAGAQAFLDIGAYELGQAGFAISGEDDDY
jgi:hypothetical protein